MMTGEGTIMQTMTKPRKPKTQQSRAATTEPKKSREGRPVMLYLDDHTAKAMDSFRGSQRFPPTITDVITVALQEFLKREGHLSPAAKP
jgi:hypothetical protein